MTAASSLRRAINTHLPWLSFPAKAIVDALLLSGGPIGSARRVANHLALGNRSRLATFLRANGLPPLHRLAGWITVLGWVWRWEHQHVPLARSALETTKDPAAAYRLVLRLTEKRWTEVRAAGIEWALSRFMEECGDCARKRTSASVRSPLNSVGMQQQEPHGGGIPPDPGGG